MPAILKRRYLRPKKFGNSTKDFYVFDTETGIQSRQKNGLLKTEYFLSARPEHLIFGVIYGPKNFVKVLFSAKEFQKEFKKNRYKKKIIYAHNAEYDLSAVYGNIYKLDPDAIFNGKFISCSNGVCRFADSFNLLPCKVSKLGELIGYPKKELGKNLISKDFKKDVDYCIRDCEIVYKSLEKLFKEAEPSYTIGSLSLKIYLSSFLEKGIKINELSDLFFNSFYGGRTEAFKIGEVNAQVVDLNSAYPDAMQKLTFPDPARLRIAPNETWERYITDLNFQGQIEATVYVPENIYIPMLPYRTKDKLMFPVGEFRGTWTLIEFRYAVENFDVQVKEVHQLIISESIDTPFKPYIDFYYNLRKKTKDEFEKYYYKLFMNNLYGKLVQRARSEFRFCSNIDEAKTFLKQRKIKRAEFIKVNDGYFLKYDVNKIFNHTIACWGAQITAYVRVKLHKQMMREPHKVVYCDTDSIFVQSDWSDLNSSELGEWKKEDKKVIQIRALKDYVYIERNKDTGKDEKKQMLKGVKKDAKQLDEHANVFKTKRMIKTRESFRRVDNLPPGTFIEQMKVMTGDYSKRKILRNGNTRAFKLNEFEQ